MNQNQTMTPAALLPAVTATRIARIKAAQERHTLSTIGTWTAYPATKGSPATVRPPVHRQTPEQLQQTADHAASLALRAREQSSGLNFMRELAQQAGNDRIVTRFPELANEAAEERTKAARARQTADNLRAYAKRKDTPYTAAKAARAEADNLSKQADQHSAKAAALESVIHATTSSDRADIVQAAIAAALTHDHAANPDGAFPAMCKAAGQSIGAIASPSALTAHRTKVQEITPAEAAALIQRYGEDTKIPHTVRGCTSQCYDTVELRTRGRGTDRRSTWCKVSHYLTVAPYISFEAITTADENGNEDTPPEYLTNGGLNAVDSLGAAEAVEELLKRANLTPRESDIVRKVADQTATTHAEAAAREYWDKRNPEIDTMRTKSERNQARKRAEETADHIRTNARWGSALDRCGIHSKANRKTVKSRIIAKLTEARQTPEALTKAEQDERTRRRWESLQRNSRRQYSAPEATAPDIIGAVQAHAATIPAPAAVVRWISTGATNGATWTPAPRQRCPETLAPSGEAATPPAMTPREAREAAKLAARVADLESLIARYEATKNAMTEADTRSPEARAEAERMRAAAANLKPAKTR